MFTGLIQKLGTLQKVTRRGKGASLTIKHTAWDEPVADGESIAVNGACLTVTNSSKVSFECDLLEETLVKTNLGSKRHGALLNLERAMRPIDRLGGHFVTGHIDGLGSLIAARKVSEDVILEIACDQEVMKYICTKGSVTCDGVSLTVTDISTSAFKVNLIPFTLKNTTLLLIKPGNTINIETDILAKYVLRHSDKGKRGQLTVERLHEFGFL